MAPVESRQPLLNHLNLMSKLRETLMNSNEMLREYDDLESVSESAGDETLTSDLLFAQRDMKPLAPVFNTAEMRCMEEGGRVTVYDALPVHNKAELAYLLEERFGIPATMLEVEVDEIPGLGHIVTYRCLMRELRPLELAGVVKTRGGSTHPNGYWSNSIWLDELAA